jgi:hypothetical protein
MKKHIIIAFAVLSTALMSCEPEEVLVDSFTPNPVDTTFFSGMSMRLNFNGSPFTYNSQGYGLLCTDSIGQTSWALITGNGVQFDPLNNDYSTAPGDTSLFLVFNSQAASIGSYSIANFEDAFCLLDAPGNIFRLYDPTQLAINITRITPDSIFGDYSGALLEYISLNIDSLGNVTPVYTGVVDSVSTIFGLKRNPC